MSMFNWIIDLFSYSPTIDVNESVDSWRPDNLLSPNLNDEFVINPANGLPMVGGIVGVDVQGNAYGTDWSHETFSSRFEDSWSSGLDDSWGGIGGGWDSDSGCGFSDW